MIYFLVAIKIQTCSPLSCSLELQGSLLFIGYIIVEGVGAGVLA